MKKTKEEVYNEVVNYINGKKHNKPCMLQSIKKEFRTPEIIRLIFDNPKIFNLDAEFSHIPEEYLTEELIIEFVLRNPKRMSLIDDGEKREIIIPSEKQTLAVLVAFEYSKRKYEYLSRRIWGSSYESIYYSAKTEEYKDIIVRLTSEIEQRYPEKDFVNILDPKVSIKDLVKRIKDYCSDKTLASSEKYNRKYEWIRFDIDKKLMILVTGAPDSGKSTFARRLSYVIGGLEFSSDFLYERGLISAPLESLVNENAKCVIFSDTDANRFFTASELADYEVINIIIKPSSNFELHRHSKYNSNLDFKTHIDNEIKKYKYDYVENPIVIVNDYTDNIYKEIDRAIDEIINRLNLCVYQYIDEEDKTDRIINDLQDEKNEGVSGYSKKIAKKIN